MTSLRQILRAHRHVALAIVVFALLMRLIVPTGFMPDVSAGKITVVLCTGHGPTTIEMPMSGGHPKQGQSAKPDMPCPFGAGSFKFLTGADPILLAIAIAFVMALGFTPRPLPRLGQAAHLRPPSRGPPLTV